MNLALGLFLIWVGCAMIWFASRETQATRPWAAFQEILNKIREGAAEAVTE